MAAIIVAIANARKCGSDNQCQPINNVYIALTIVLLPIVTLWLFRRWKRGLAAVPTNEFYHYPTRLS